MLVAVTVDHTRIDILADHPPVLSDEGCSRIASIFLVNVLKCRQDAKPMVFVFITHENFDFWSPLDAKIKPKTTNNPMGAWIVNSPAPCSLNLGICCMAM
ncbi:hypothetical protein GLAREA_10978 [Glarea lozoyensis ATCC 20868]|uniref:Uncharacterized protein n=1 Tax=Glarea lozoyensis (strain ATCC 20868 / MF5171) TaxID=1116229 RepID=S3DDX5_GLAL2|nr:uncharacterized protein GLAREA_10978 [Glarea lozoyensis ATCC 20868]EPE35279.1 hypothetical protein GLAREA_10978 [Glarea lozoyensis ATCC 20868]